MSEGHRAERKIKTLIAMIRDHGASPAGSLPPDEHLQAVEDAGLRELDAVRQAHAESRSPPAVRGPGDDRPDRGPE